MIVNRRLCVIAVVVSLLFCISSASAQITVQGGTLDKDSTPQPKAEQYPSQVQVEFHMTAEEAAKLLASVDEVIALDSKITGLPVRGHVERQITNRDELKQLTEKRMKEAEVSESVQRSSAVLQKFGFVPREFNLQQFAVDSTVSELAAYYEPKVKTMYLLNWLPAMVQKPVMAHELDHALQDQSFDLQNWLKTDFPAADDATGGDPSEQRAARRAVVEGHATAVMMDYMLAAQGRSLAELPLLTPELVQSIANRFASPTMQSAPLMLREDMTFPYLYGLMFVQQVLLKGGKDQAYSGIFKRPPESTRQIMEPATYLAHEKLAPLPIPLLEPLLGSGYEKLESGSIGEFDSMIFMEQFGSPEAKELPKNWRGDWFYAAKRVPGGGSTKAETKDTRLSTANVALVFVSRWANPAAAKAFLNFYREAVPQRYSDAKPAQHLPASQLKEGEAWETREGKVTVGLEGNLVVALESFDDETASRLIGAVLKTDK
jgi:hypothetical protein